MENIKKLLAALLCASALLGAVSCSAPENGTDGTGESMTEGESGPVLVLPSEETEDTGEAVPPSMSVKQEFPSDWSKAEKARQAIKNVLLDQAWLRYVPVEGEAYDARFGSLYDISTTLRYGICSVDVDGDGVEEIALGDVLLPDALMLILHYEDGIVYGYVPPRSGYSYYYLRENGTVDVGCYGTAHPYYGGKLRLSFEGGACKSELIYWYDREFRFFTPSSALVPLGKAEKEQIQAQWYSNGVEYCRLNEAQIEYTLFDRGILSKDGLLLFMPNGDGTCSVSAFGHFESMDELVIPEVAPNGDTVTSIGAGGFRFRQYYEELSIPKTVTSIGEQAFVGSRNLYIHVSGENPVYESVYGALIESSTKTLVYRSGNFRELESGTVERIGDYAYFGAYAYTTLQIPDGVLSIGGYAFSLYGGAVRIPLSVLFLDRETFTDSDITTVIYDGTRAKWEKLVEGLNQASFCFTVKCADGEIVYQNGKGGPDFDWEK